MPKLSFNITTHWPISFNFLCPAGIQSRDRNVVCFMWELISPIDKFETNGTVIRSIRVPFLSHPGKPFSSLHSASIVLRIVLQTNVFIDSSFLFPTVPIALQMWPHLTHRHTHMLSELYIFSKLFWDQGCENQQLFFLSFTDFF